MIMLPPKVKDLTALLSSCPYWTLTKKADTKQRERIAAILTKVAMSDLDSIRMAEEVYGDGGYFRGGNLLILNNLVFDLPRSEITKWRLGGAFVEVGTDKWTRTMMWPLSYDARGKIVLSGTAGAYYGAPYLSLADFDELRKRFPRRNFSDKK